jgi:hypothetical protein
VFYWGPSLVHKILGSVMSLKCEHGNRSTGGKLFEGAFQGFDLGS